VIDQFPAIDVAMSTHAGDPEEHRRPCPSTASGLVGADVGAWPSARPAGRIAELRGDLRTILEGSRRRTPAGGDRALVTAGRAAEPVDPHPHADEPLQRQRRSPSPAALAALGAEYTWWPGRWPSSTPPGVRRVDVDGAREMLAACEAALPADVAVCVAAGLVAPARHGQDQEGRQPAANPAGGARHPRHPVPEPAGRPWS
jgi:phosphopantothenoylcysteine decarboxylase/phosphopantothenate--cysteine ligase